MSEITGEYWVIDGQVDFADGDVSDQNHEGIAISHIMHQFSSEVEDLAQEYDIDIDIEHYGELDTEAISSALSEIHERLSENMSDARAHALIMKELNCDKDAYAILLGGGDAREYAMEHLGWIAVRSNNVELYGYDTSRQAEIAEAIEEILYEEGHHEVEDPSEVEIGIYDYKTRKSWHVTLEDLKAPQIVSRPQQNLQTTMNNPVYNASKRDDEENKYAAQKTPPNKSNQYGLQKSVPNKWNAAAVKAGVIPPKNG